MELYRFVKLKKKKSAVFYLYLAVFSSEPAIRTAIREDRSSPYKRSTTGTVSFMPAAFGCHCAAAVIRTLLEDTSRS